MLKAGIARLLGREEVGVLLVLCAWLEWWRSGVEGGLREGKASGVEGVGCASWDV